MNPFVIALWGPIGVGKDTVCAELGWPKASFAEVLKGRLRPMLKELVNIDIDVREDKERVRPILGQCAQTLRDIDPFVAIKKIDFPSGPRACVTDLRCWNEIEKVWGMGGVVYRLHRDGINFVEKWESDAAADIWLKCSERNITIPVIHNVTPAQAAEDIRQDLRQRSANILAAIHA